MEVSDLILSDYASVGSRGKFTLVGAGYTEIITKKLPCIHPLMFIFVRLKVSSEDKGRNRISLRIVKNDTSIFKADINMEVSKKHKGIKYVSLPTQISNIRFNELGEYNVKVEINGEKKAEQFLSIKKYT